MLLEPVDRQIGKYQKPVYIVRGTDSTEECILVETLMGVDIEYLNFAYTEGSGETLYDKMKSLTLPNGSNALRFFSPRIKKYPTGSCEHTKNAASQRTC